MGTKRVQIDEDLVLLPLTLDKASRVMELRREHADLTKRVSAMEESFEKRVDPHRERLAAIVEDEKAILEEASRAREE